MMHQRRKQRLSRRKAQISTPHPYLTIVPNPLDNGFTHCDGLSKEIPMTSDQLVE